MIGLPSSALVPLLKDNTLDRPASRKRRALRESSSGTSRWCGPGRRQEKCGRSARFHSLCSHRAVLHAPMPSMRCSGRTSGFACPTRAQACWACSAWSKRGSPSRRWRDAACRGTGPAIAERRAAALDDLEVVLARSARSARPPCDFLAEQIRLRCAFERQASAMRRDPVVA